MDEWVVSILVTIGGLALISVVLYLKENHSRILVGVIVGIVAILISFGLINMVHSFIYELLPLLRGVR